MLHSACEMRRLFMEEKSLRVASRGGSPDVVYRRTRYEHLGEANNRLPLETGEVMEVLSWRADVHRPLQALPRSVCQRPSFRCSETCPYKFAPRVCGTRYLLLPVRAEFRRETAANECRQGVRLKWRQWLKCGVWYGACGSICPAYAAMSSMRRTCGYAGRQFEVARSKPAYLALMRNPARG